MKHAAIIALALAVLTLSGCNTMEGLGKDIEKAGEGLSDTATDTKDKMRR